MAIVKSPLAPNLRRLRLSLSSVDSVQARGSRTSRLLPPPTARRGVYLPEKRDDMSLAPDALSGVRR